MAVTALKQEEDLSDGQAPGGMTYDEMAEALDRLSTLKQAVNERNGELRNAIKEIIENFGIHKQALAVIRQIDDMSETKRADFLRSFRPMFDAMDLHKWEEEGRNLLDQLEGEEG